MCYCNNADSGKHETISELESVINLGSSCLSDELINIPFEVLLVYTLTINCMFFENSIQARFSGIGLPTTIKDLNIIITNLCNLVAVQIHIGDTIIITNNTGVCRLPGLAVSDGIVHLLFDLTHERKVVLIDCLHYWDTLKGPVVIKSAARLGKPRKISESLKELTSEHIIE